MSINPHLNIYSILPQVSQLTLVIEGKFSSTLHSSSGLIKITKIRFGSQKTKLRFINMYTSWIHGRNPGTLSYHQSGRSHHLKYHLKSKEDAGLGSQLWVVTRKASLTRVRWSCKFKSFLRYRTLDVRVAPMSAVS